MFITKSRISEIHANLIILIILFLSARYILFLLIKSTSIVQKFGFREIQKIYNFSLFLLHSKPLAIIAQHLFS